MKIYLARHGETDWNAERRLQGWTDVPLNENGMDQARRLAKTMDAIQLDAIYCSALRRSIETAEMLQRKPLFILMELNEQSLGRYEGLQLEGEDLSEFQKRRSNPEDSLDGGESTLQHRTRIRSALDRIRANHHAEHSQVLVVGHGGTNSVILRELFQLQTDLMFRIGNQELFLIDLPEKGSPTLWKYLTIQ